MITFRSNEHKSSSNNNPFPEKIVHFDLKGAPPKVGYFEKVFRLLRHMNVTALLMEYEDMFPYYGPLSKIRRRDSYTKSDISMIVKLAKINQLEIIPLIQTLGHMEFALKHHEFSHLRIHKEALATICPTSNESWNLISNMLKQVRKLHPSSRRIHIGTDEAIGVKPFRGCFFKSSVLPIPASEELMLHHISRTARFAQRRLKFEEVLAWNDMFAGVSVSLLKAYAFDKLITPVIWGYSTNVTFPGYFPQGMFERFGKVFEKIMFASAYKGANGIQNVFINVSRYLDNHISYVRLYNTDAKAFNGKVGAIILTGWQRYNHFAPLCELHPSSIPSLVINLLYLSNTSLNLMQLVELACEQFKCAKHHVEQSPIHVGNSTYLPPIENLFTNCSFVGSDMYDAIEDLRMIVWKYNQISLHYTHFSKPFAKELLNTTQKLESSLRRYFNEDSVQEFITANLHEINRIVHLNLLR